MSQELDLISRGLLQRFNITSLDDLGLRRTEIERAIDELSFGTIKAIAEDAPVWAWNTARGFLTPEKEVAKKAVFHSLRVILNK